MTTIAWDGKTLAADSLRTAGDTIETNPAIKVFKDVGVYKLAAITGDHVKSNQILHWIKNIGGAHNFPIPACDDNTAVICITEKAEVIVYRADSKGEPLNHGVGMYTDGSGWQLALGALEAGADAVKAVEIACKRDVYSGGEVKSYELPPV